MSDAIALAIRDTVFKVLVARSDWDLRGHTDKLGEIGRVRRTDPNEIEVEIVEAGDRVRTFTVSIVEREITPIRGAKAPEPSRRIPRRPITRSAT